MGHNDRLHELTFLHMGRKYRLMEAGHLGGASSMATMRRVRHGMVDVRQLVKSACAVELRKFLQQGNHRFNPNNEELIRSRVAEMVVEGTLCLFETVGHASASHCASAASPGGNQSPVYESVDPRKMQSPTNLTNRQEPTPRPVAIQKAEQMNEEAQAAVLVEAAAQGTPLCAICKN